MFFTALLVLAATPASNPTACLAASCGRNGTCADAVALFACDQLATLGCDCSDAPPSSPPALPLPSAPPSLPLPSATPGYCGALDDILTFALAASWFFYLYVLHEHPRWHWVVLLLQLVVIVSWLVLAFGVCESSSPAWLVNWLSRNQLFAILFCSLMLIFMPSSTGAPVTNTSRRSRQPRVPSPPVSWTAACACCASTGCSASRRTTCCRVARTCPTTPSSRQQMRPWPRRAGLASCLGDSAAQEERPYRAAAVQSPCAPCLRQHEEGTSP